LDIIYKAFTLFYTFENQIISHLSFSLNLMILKNNISFMYYKILMTFEFN